MSTCETTFSRRRIASGGVKARTGEVAVRLEGAERKVLQSIRDLQGDSADYVEDARIAAATRMAVGDVRDWLETLEHKGLIERARGTQGDIALLVAKGRQALRMSLPIPAGPATPAPTRVFPPTRASGKALVVGV